LSASQLESLLSPVSADSPCGDDLVYDLEFLALEEKLRGVPEIEIGGKIVQKAQPPDWPKIEASALELSGRTRDLRVVVTLLRARLHNHGLPGLNSGCRLLRELIARFWEHLHPQLDPEDGNDPTQRINILLELCDRECLLRPLMDVTLYRSQRLGNLSLRDLHIVSGRLTAPGDWKRKDLDVETIENALIAGDATVDPEVYEAAEETLAGLKAIEASLNQRLGGTAIPFVDFSPLRRVLEEIRRACAPRETAAEVDPVNGSRSELEGRQEEEPLMSPRHQPRVQLPGTIAGRADVIRMLKEICSWYKTAEPSSPVPLLLTRAMSLIEKNFMEIIEDLAPDSLKQVEMISGKRDGDS